MYMIFPNPLIAIIENGKDNIHKNKVILLIKNMSYHAQIDYNQNFCYEKLIRHLFVSI